MREDLQLVCSAVTSLTGKVGQFILQERKRFRADRVEKKGRNDLVSYVDKEAERMLVDGLADILPDAGFLTEEKTRTDEGNGLRWIIDPLDGTTNFIHGIPCYCISIGLFDGNKGLVGVVHELNLDECFYASADNGAYLNGEPIRTSNVPSLADSLIATGFPYHDYDRMKPYMEVFDHCMRHTRGLRRLGSAAADLAYVAAGRFEIFYEYGLNPWDVAGGIVLVREAGGIVTDFSGEDNPLYGAEIIAGGPEIQNSFLDVVRERFRP